jgi:hypothetical protein
MTKLITRYFNAWLIILFLPLFAYSGVDDELNRNLSKSKCVKTWRYDKSAFRIYFNTKECKQKEPTAVLMAVRYIFESNKAKFPKRIEVDYGNGPIDSFPFAKIPSLTK